MKGHGWTEEEMTVFTASVVAVITVIEIEEFCNSLFLRTPWRVGDYERRKIINGIIRAGDNEYLAQPRMNKNIFYRLCSLLRDRNLLPDGKHVSMEEQLVMFLHTVGHNVRNRVIGHRFILSRQTVSKYFSKALDAIVALYPEFVKLPSAEISTEILSNPNWSTYFQDCIGAIDGTHISAYVSMMDSVNYRNQKEVLSQNIIAACTFDMKFIFVLARWEGSASNAHVLQSALTHSHDRFTVPEGKYYIVDVGYAHLPGFMAPYRGVRYHLNEYRAGRKPCDKRELFNYRHAQLRNVVERIFRVLKARFPILKLTPPYSLLTQLKIIIACSVLHNIIRGFGGDGIVANEDPSMDIVDDIDPSPVEFSSQEDGPMVTNATQRERDEWNKFRDNIATRMWNDYNPMCRSL